MSKTILSIGGHQWVAPDMARAGKVADILSEFTPVNRDYRNSVKDVFVSAKTRDHVVSITELPDSAVIVKSIDEAVKLRDKKDDKDKQLL